MQISPFDKYRYERNFPTDWQNDKYVICKFPLKVEPTRNDIWYNSLQA